MTALPVAACPTEAELEFDRQVDALVMAGLPEALDLAERRASGPRWSRCATCCPTPSRTAPTIPFVVVVPHLPVVPVLEAVHTVGGSGFTTMDDDDLARFRPLPELRGAGRPVPAPRRRPGRATP